MKGYYINLERSKDRKSLMKANLITSNFIRVKGITPVDKPKNIIPSSIGYAMTATEECCFLSHLECWKLIAQSDEPYGFICEDDVNLQKGILEQVSNILNDNLPQFLHITFGSNKLKEVTFKDLIRCGTYSYIISKELASFLVQQFEKDNKIYVADLYHEYMPEAGKVFQLQTNLIKWFDTSKESTIEVGMFNQWKEHLISSGMKLTNWII